MDERALNTQDGATVTYDVRPGGPEQAAPIEHKEIGQTQGPAKQLSKAEFKQLMGKFFTVRHKTVKACGHKLDTNQDPRHNCESCWFASFSMNGDTTRLADQCFQEGGAALLTKFRGSRFTKNFLKYMSTLARFQKEAEQAEAAKTQESNDTIEGQENGIDGAAGRGSTGDNANGGNRDIDGTGEAGPNNGQPATTGTPGPGPTEHEGTLGRAEEGGASL